MYEDALTILSYASPYPVQLQVQKKPPKPSDSDVTGDDYEEAQHLHHPIYRSQSMDDVSKIAQDSVFRVRRARSEMKRGSSKRKQEEAEVVVEEGRLRKWSGKPDFGEPVVGSLEDAASDQKSENSTVSIPDLRIDTTDLMASYSSGQHRAEVTEATVHHELESAYPAVRLDQVNLDEVRLDQTEAPTLGLSPKRQAELDRKEGLRLSYEADHPVKKLDLDDAVILELNADNPGLVDEIDLATLAAKLDSADGEVESSLEAGFAGAESPSRRSPSPVIISGDMATGLRIGSSSDPPMDTSLHLVPDVGREVAVTSQTMRDSVAVVTEHDDFVDIDLKNAGPSVDSSSPPPSPPPHPPPALLDSAADVTESSMHVLLSEESILRRDDSSQDGAPGAKGSDDEPPSEADDSVRAVLKDYFSDQPSLMERLGLALPDSLEAAPVREGEAEVKLTPRLGAAPTSSADKASAEAAAREIRARNGKALQEAKMMIRRRSSSSEEELPHASSPSTLSSRSSSPTDPTQEDAAQDVSLEEQAEEPAAGAPRARANKKSHSPVVTKRSSGGLMYDISPTEFEEMAVDVPGKDRLNSQAGVAYYVSIDDKFHGAPLTQEAEDDDPCEDDEEEKPSLVKAWGRPNMSSAPRYGIDHADDGAGSTQTVTEVVTLETDGPGSLVTETRTSTVTTMQMSNNNNDFGLNSKGSKPTLSIPLKPGEVVTTEVSKSNEVITVTRHEEIQGAYTLTVNTTSHNDDSEA